MFVKAIDIAAEFTRPIHSIGRNYKSDLIQPGAATLFFVNSEGWALTCRHVAEQIIGADQLLQKRHAFTGELVARRGEAKEKVLLRELEKKHGYSRNALFELHNRFCGCVEGQLEINMRTHKAMDVALIQFRHFTKLLCGLFPVFASDDSALKQGKFLCRLGFPFPEFTNYAYDSAADSIHWTDTGRQDSPRFPIEGMVTRHLVDDSHRVVGFELSTPGLRGQSGGPAFDTEGVVWGMQAATNHLDLDFDVDQEVVRRGQKRRVSDSAFLHVGRCIHVSILKEFMRENEVAFQEEHTLWA